MVSSRLWERIVTSTGWKAGEMVQMEVGRGLRGRADSNPPLKAPKRHRSTQQGRNKSRKVAFLFVDLYKR